MDARFLCRGKRTDSYNKEWVHGHYVSVPRPMIVLEELQLNGSWSWFEVDPTTAGKCTGLEDKDGKLIFEGDRVQRKCHIFTLGQKAPTGERMMVGTVIWDDNRSKEAGSWAVDSYDEHGNPAKYILLADMEIIGTIHDDPELLGGEKGGGE